MKAAQIKSYGGVEVIEINDHASKPMPSKNQVLVEVYAASLNPVDWKMRAGFLREMMPLQFPATLGGDFSGKVSARGDEVLEFKVGDEVFGQAIVLNGGSGSFAQYLIANTSNTAFKPKTASFEEASALPLVGVSAVQALEAHIKLQSKQKILIHGGAGGIGHIAIQLAKALGAYVATTVKTEDLEFVKGLGADQIINYQTQKFEEIIKNFDAVFDTVGGEITKKSFQVLKKGGILISMLGQPDKEFAQKYDVIAIGQNTQTNTKQLMRLRELVDSGKIKVHLDKEYPLAKIKEAFKDQEEGHPQGKVVLKVKG